MSGLIEEVDSVVSTSIARAKSVWQTHGSYLSLNASFSERLAKAKTDVMPSLIPGHDDIDEDTNEVDNFIAVVPDMRDSTRHLTCAIAGTRASQLERIYYETSVLLPALATVICHHNGAVTEYLGDGVLGLFRYENEEQVYAVSHAAKDFFNIAMPRVNRALEAEFDLPKLELGVGMAYSKALVTTVGLDRKRHPKVFGECVYRAMKLSGGVNKIRIDDRLEKLWPQREDGPVRFRPITSLPFKAFEMDWQK